MPSCTFRSQETAFFYCLNLTRDMVAALHSVSFGKLSQTAGMFSLRHSSIRCLFSLPFSLSPSSLSLFFCARKPNRCPVSEVTLTGSLTHPTPTHFTNDGERDMASSPPSQFLLFRNLEAGVNEEVLSKGVLKLAVPASAGGASESSVKRVLLVRDRRTNESWRFGFAEFSTPLEAQKAFRSYETMEKFTISSRPVTVSYIHPGVFVPVYNASSEANYFTFLPLTPVGGGMRLAYWDEEGYVSELELGNDNSDTADETRGSAAAQVAGAQTDKTEKKTKKRKADGSSAGSGSLAAAEKQAAKKAAPLPAHLQFWQDRHSELHGRGPKVKLATQPQVEARAEGKGKEVGEGKPSAAATQQPSEGTSNSGFQESFADMGRLACLLCLREFKAAETLRQHERISALHLNNLKDPALCEKARARLAAKKKQSSSSAPEYRDRAKERREAFGSLPTPTAAGTSSSRKQKAGTSPPPLEEAEEPAKPHKGAALLGKMGWTQGQGLGVAGEGRKDHLVAEVYTAGVGLGMKGAKVGDVEEAVTRGRGGYSEFVRKTKERAKERFHEMD